MMSESLTHPQKMRIRQNFKKNASNAREVTGVVFFESPCDLQALGAASRCTSHVSLTAYQLLALMSAKFLTSFFGDW